MNKVLVKLYVPMIQEQYDLWLPKNRKIYNVIILLVKAVNDLSAGYYTPKKMPILYDKLSAKAFDTNLKVKDAEIKNGTELLLI